MDNTPEEKKTINADINNIKAKLHIHTAQAKLTKEQIEEIVERARREFGKQLEEPPQSEEPEDEQAKKQDEPEQGQD